MFTPQLTPEGILKSFIILLAYEAIHKHDSQQKLISLPLELRRLQFGCSLLGVLCDQSQIPPMLIPAGSSRLAHQAAGHVHPATCTPSAHCRGFPTCWTHFHSTSVKAFQDGATKTQSSYGAKSAFIINRILAHIKVDDWRIVFQHDRGCKVRWG